MSDRLVNLFLAISSILLCACIFLGYGWYTCSRKDTLDINRVSPNQARILLHQYLDRTPGVLRYAWFDPDVGYTLKPNAKLSCWGDTFKSNELGYRTHKTRKDKNIYRVVFIGDSWTYGMGVSALESFPYQFEAIANSFSGLSQKVQAWSLALPGYNTVNELAALDAFFDRIKPDAIILCPTINDIDSTLGVSQTGRFMRNRGGCPKELNFFVKTKPFDSCFMLNRWAKVFSSFRHLSERLEEKDLPFFIFFVAGWNPAVVHHFMSKADIEAPYAIVPVEYLRGEWRQPQEKFGHGTPNAYAIFAEILYGMVSEKLGWKRMPGSAKKIEGHQKNFFLHTPSGDWNKACNSYLKAIVKRYLPYNFRPGSRKSEKQCMGKVDWKTGSISSGKSIVFLRRHSKATHLSVYVKRIPEASFLYPLNLEIMILSRAGTITKRVQIPEKGTDIGPITMPIPKDIEENAAIDFIIDVPRSTVDDNDVSLSLYLLGIDQQ